jgi:hypothetical protein
VRLPPATHRIVRRLCLSVSQNGVSVAVDDDRGVRAIAGSATQKTPGISGEVRGFAIAGQRMNDYNGHAFEALCLVGGAS